MSTPQYLTPGDLDHCIGAAAVTRLSDDSGDGVRDTPTLNSIMAQAEGLAASYLLRAFNPSQVLTLMASDPHLVSQVAWIGCELLSERRGEFVANDGKGRYWAQYERAISCFDRLAKATVKSMGETLAGQNPQSGGNVRPKSADGNNPTFIFAPDRESPKGRGGY